MTDHRTERITEAIREEVAEIISYEIVGPRLRASQARGWSTC